MIRTVLPTGSPIALAALAGLAMLFTAGATPLAVTGSALDNVTGVSQAHANRFKGRRFGRGVRFRRGFRGHRSHGHRIRGHRFRRHHLRRLGARRFGPRRFVRRGISVRRFGSGFRRNPFSASRNR